MLLFFADSKMYVALILGAVKVNYACFSLFNPGREITSMANG